jgi:hypothetical protein
MGLKQCFGGSRLERFGGGLSGTAIGLLFSAIY